MPPQRLLRFLSPSHHPINVTSRYNISKISSHASTTCRRVSSSLECSTTPSKTTTATTTPVTLNTYRRLTYNISPLVTTRNDRNMNTPLLPTTAIIISTKKQQQNHQHQHRHFQTESSFHDIADETLDKIQESLEDMFEDFDITDGEVNVASGVLTYSLSGKGYTWVINKQTPNRQIWWSSPLSGPRRYEYDERRGVWVYTRDVDMAAAAKVDSMEDEEGGGVVIGTLGGILKEEMKDLLGVDLYLDV